MNTLLGKTAYQITQALRREPVTHRLKQMDRHQWLSVEELKHLQFEKLRGQLIHCYENIPFYHDRFRKCQFDPYLFSDERQMKSIPTLTKKEIQTHFNTLQISGFSKPHTTETTSGSTGNPMTFLADRPFAAGFRASIYLGHQWAGLPIGAPEGRFYGMPMSGKAYCKERFKDMLMNRIRCSVFDLSDEAMQRFWNRLQRFKPRYLHGYTSALSRFSTFVRQQNLKPHFKLQCIITTAEMLSEQEKVNIETTWHAPVFNEYGCSELGILASQCERGAMHLHTSTNYIEFKPLRHTQEGPCKIIATNLDNKIMPLIRYELGDSGTPIDKPCSCGRGLPTMHIMDGRLSAMLMTPNGKIVSGWVFYYMFRSLLEKRSAPLQFQIHQKSLTHIHFLLESSGDMPSHIETTLAEKGHAFLGQNVCFTFEYVDQIPAPKSGKRIHFQSDINMDIAGNQIPVQHQT